MGWELEGGESGGRRLGRCLKSGRVAKLGELEEEKRSGAVVEERKSRSVGCAKLSRRFKGRTRGGRSGKFGLSERGR